MNPAANLFLIGPMGAGKSTIGRRLAAHFGLAFVDLDAEIEARTGVAVTTIFELEGEAGFRVREATLLEEFCRREGIVLATGGGAVLRADNRARLAAHGFVVYLAASVSQQLARLARDGKRPLLKTPDRRERLEALAREREPLYRAIADLEVETAAGGPAPAARRIAALLRERWQRSVTEPAA
jgi:shikimate kinase